MDKTEIRQCFKMLGEINLHCALLRECLNNGQKTEALKEVKRSIEKARKDAENLELLYDYINNLS